MSEWISVKDKKRKPIMWQTMLCIGDFHGQFPIKVGFYDGVFNECMTHWMPLPEPPK